MRTVALALATLSLLLSPGCGLLPKRVEYFQRKVEAVPEKTERASETERQAAAFIATTAREVELLAVREQTSTNMQEAAGEVVTVAQALSTSLGPPAEPWDHPATPLALKLAHAGNKLDRAVEDYRQDVAPDVGKKIEGTGVIQLGYFTNLLFIGGGLLALWVVGKIVLSIYAPGVSGVVGQVAKVPLSTLKGLAEQTVKGVEGFKAQLGSLGLESKLEASIRSLLRSELEKKQDQQVQKVARELTDKG